MVTVNPANAIRNGTASLHRAHSGVTPELLSTLGFIDEQQYERLYRARAMPNARRRWARVPRRVGNVLLPSGICCLAAIALLFMAPHAHASEDTVIGAREKALQFVVIPSAPPAAAVVSRATIAASATAAARTRILAAIPSLDPTGLGDVTSGFGYRTDPAPEFHRGIDLAAPSGHPVEASAAGVVAFAGWSGGFGNKVEIDHGNGYATWYAHLSRIDVAVGQRIERGSVIAAVGETGEATGPHLHYQIMLNGVAIDPAPYLNRVPDTVLASLKTR